MMIDDVVKNECENNERRRKKNIVNDLDHIDICMFTYDLWQQYLYERTSR